MCVYIYIYTHILDGGPPEDLRRPLLRRVLPDLHRLISCVYIYIYTYVYTVYTISLSLYIYIERERLYHIYIYIYT